MALLGGVRERVLPAQGGVGAVSGRFTRQNHERPQNAFTMGKPYIPLLFTSETTTNLD